MLTTTDIPPGGEGQIEVTFDSSHKKGQQQKSITVESNDPRNPRATLSVSALIDVAFGFEEYNLDMGTIRKGQSVSKSTILIAKDPSITKTITLVSSSPLFTATLANNPTAEKGRLTVQVSGAWGAPAGPFNATITARAGDQTALEAVLPIRGGMIGNFEVSPEIIRFHVDTSKGEAESVTQVIKIVNTTEGANYHILGLEDAYGRLTFHVDTLVASKQYEVSLTPQPEVLRARKNVSGTVTITTDDKEQPEMKVTYAIFFGR